MTRIRVQTPSRLHFGLLGWGPGARRQFGGLGLMIGDPGLELTVEAADRWQARGPLADRALQIAQTVQTELAARGHALGPLSLTVEKAPSAHVGLGVGTQLSLGVARASTVLAGLPDLPAHELALMTDRGRRSGIGIHGFEEGGFILDGGRKDGVSIPPRLLRLPFPEHWSIALITPDDVAGLHGSSELAAFRELPSIDGTVTDQLCGLVLLGLVPSLVETDFLSFGATLANIQDLVGRCFAPAQGGAYASSDVGKLVRRLRSAGLGGVGQSSWGPTLYGFTDASGQARLELAARLCNEVGLRPEQIHWTKAANHGARILIEE
jgi:beta-ribofuranosylaminobenzene 5'-phosphate synthase